MMSGMPVAVEIGDDRPTSASAVDTDSHDGAPDGP